MDLTQLLAPVLDIVRQLAANPAVGGTIVVLSGLLIGDFVTATTAAKRRGEFNPSLLTMFLQTHVVGSWLPIVSLVVLATFTAPLIPVAGLAVGTYTVQSIASIKRNLDLPEEAA